MSSRTSSEAPSPKGLTRRSSQRRIAILVAGVAAALLLAPSTAFAGLGTHACAVLSSGKVNCWGNNSSGQLGNNSSSNSSVPVEVSGITNAVQASAGADHSCAVLSSGKINCWGYNYSGNLGNNSSSNSSVPVEVSGITNAVQVSAGMSYSCAVLSSGKLNCWGLGASGRLGNNSTASSKVPVEVSGITNAVQVSVGAGFACAVLLSGKVNCWGENRYGQLGNNSTTSSSVPVEVSGITNAVRIGVGGYHSCAVLSSGKVDCWGTNGNGQLGNNSTTSSSTPVEVSGITNAKEISLGYYHTCTVLSSGNVTCWGANNLRQLAVGGSTDGSDVPLEVAGISNAVLVTLENSSSCVLLSSGKAKCWGFNGSPASDDPFESTPEILIGSLGNGSVGATSSAVPVEVSKVSNFAHLGESVPQVAPADTTAPSTPGSFTGVPSSPTNQTGATIGFTLGESGGTVECRVDSGSWGACSSVSGTSGSKTVSGLADGSHSVSVRQTDAAGNVSSVGTSPSWTVTTAVAPISTPTVLTPATGTKTVEKTTVNGKNTWLMKLGLLFSTGGDTRAGARIMSVQVAVDGSGKPVSAKPSDSQAPPIAAVFTQGVVAWGASGETTRSTMDAPVWVRVSNRVGKWTGWVKLTQ